MPPTRLLLAVCLLAPPLVAVVATRLDRVRLAHRDGAPLWRRDPLTR